MMENEVASLSRNDQNPAGRNAKMIMRAANKLERYALMSQTLIKVWTIFKKRPTFKKYTKIAR